MVDYDPFSDAVLDDPHAVYAALRRESPVHYLERFDAWALSLFEDVWNAGQEGRHFEQPGPNLQAFGIGDNPLTAGDEPERRSLFAMNPPMHTELRKRLARHFTAKAVAALEPSVREQVRACLAHVLPTGRCEVIGDLAAQISVQVTCLLIGLPVADGPRLARIVHRFFAREPGFEGMTADSVVAAGELADYLSEAVRERRRAGVDRFDDVLSSFLSVAIGGRPYSDDEAASQLMTLVVGGTETLPKVLAGGVRLLARHPDQRAALVRDPACIDDAFTEIARYEMPTNFLTRRVAEDVELRGQKLREGQGVLLLYRSANRDEREFDDPNRFDIARRPPRTLAFGHGTHVCVGQHAARLEARIMLEELLAAVPEFEVPEDEVVPARSEFVAGYLAMPMHFEARELRA